MFLGVALRLLGFEPTIFEARLLGSQVRRLPFRRPFGFFRDQGPAMRLRHEPLRLLGLLCGCISRRFELLQLFGSAGGPGGAFGFERLTPPEELVLLCLELRESGFRSPPRRLRFCGLGRLGLGFRLELGSLELQLGERRPLAALSALEFFRFLRELGHLRFGRRAELCLLRPQARLEGFPFAALLRRFGLEPTDRLFELRTSRVQILLSADERHRLRGHLGQVGLGLALL